MLPVKSNVGGNIAVETCASAVVTHALFPSKLSLPARPPSNSLYGFGGCADWKVTDAQCVPNKPPPASTNALSAVVCAVPVWPVPNGSKQVLIMATAPN